MGAGITFGAFKLRKRLGQGGMAEVFLATASRPNGFEKRVVIKRLLPHLARSERFKAMFLSEGRFAALIDHPNLVHVWDCGELEGDLYLAMEYVDGVTLAEVLRRHGPLAPEEACAVAVDLLDALQAVHDARGLDGTPLHLVHRDVTLRNVMMTRSGAVKLLDFGIATSAGQGGAPVGTKRYMSPEQALGLPVDRRSDLFSVGVVLFHLIVGRAPFEGVPEAEPPCPPEVPEDLWPILGAALARDRDDRPRTARQMQAELEAFLSSSVSRGRMAALIREVSPGTQVVPMTRVGHLSRTLAARTRSIFAGPATITRDEPQPTVSLPAPPLAEPPPLGLPLARVAQSIALPEVSDLSAPASRSARTRALALLALLLGGALALGLKVGVPAQDGGGRAAAEVASGAPSEPAPGGGEPAGCAGAPCPPACPEGGCGPQDLPPPLLAALAPSCPDGQCGAPAEEEATQPPERREPRRRRGPAYLTVDTRPWAEVYLDGRRLGTTPLDRAAVASGVRKLRLVNPEFGIRYEADLLLRPGQKMTVNKRFQ